MSRKMITENFKSLESFIDISEERPPNAAFKINSYSLSSQKNETETNGRFSGVNTYADAVELLKNGYKEPLEKMKKAILKIGQKDNFQRPRTKNDFIGFAPNVPNALMNLPINMINKEKQAPKTKMIHLTYSICAAAKTSKEDLIKGGVNFLGLVNSLEKQGYRVKIDIIFTTVVNKTAAAVVINLKEYDQQTNLLKLAFPLVHPAMLRRFCFKWLETTPELKDKDFIQGYGVPLNYIVHNDAQKEREFLKTNGIIKGENSYYCNVYQSMKTGNVEQLARKMEIVK